MDLADFLLARIAEDEATARAAAADVITMGRSDGQTWHARDYEYEGIGVNGWPDEGKSGGERTPVTDQITAWSPARVLAECEAKRRIVARHAVCAPNYDEGNRLETRVLDWTMRLLALPYADHPDYDESWRP